MEPIWVRIETWLSVNAPAVLAALNPPATPEALAETEGLLGVVLPDDVRESYLRHDGQRGYAGFLFGWNWLSLESLRHEWTVWKELLDGGDFDGIDNDTDDRFVVTDWWHPGWIPLTVSGGGDNHCLDMAPGPHGRVGQVIEMWHDEGTRPVCASNFRQWLTEFAELLEAGEYVLSDEYGGLVRRADL